jgi:glycosyltransferase involved in cell wall biosynthesis
MQVGLITAGFGAVSVVESSPVPLALLFGNLHRIYKGSSTVEELAARGVDGWRFALVGNGAPASLPGGTTVPRLLDAGELVATVSSSAATLLPYTRASQSGAVVLAQAVGSVVVATSVGGIPEQVENRVTGRLLPLGAGVERWRDVLIELRDPEERAQLAIAARRSVERAHGKFTAGVLEIVGATR